MKYISLIVRPISNVCRYNNGFIYRGLLMVEPIIYIRYCDRGLYPSLTRPKKGLWLAGQVSPGLIQPLYTNHAQLIRSLFRILSRVLHRVEFSLTWCFTKFVIPYVPVGNIGYSAPIGHWHRSSGWRHPLFRAHNVTSFVWLRTDWLFLARG